jgi:hypothetical protein
MTTVNQTKGTVTREIESARAILTMALPAVDACRRKHHGLKVDWLQTSLVELLELSDEALARIEWLDPWASVADRIKRARPGAVEAVAMIDAVNAKAAEIELPLEACPCLSYPDTLLDSWHLAAALLESALWPIYATEGEAAELVTEDLAQRVLSACTWARQSFSLWCGSGCPCSTCSSAARAAAVRGEPLALAAPSGRPARAPRIATPATLPAGLVLAQEQARALARDGRTDDGKGFVSAGAVIAEAKESLALAGLAVEVKSSKLVRLVDERGPLGLRRIYRVVHAGGAVEEHEQDWPLGSLDALPTSANVAAASVAATKRFLIDLLLIATREDEEPDGRRSSVPEGSARARRVREVIALLPSFSRASLEDALDRAVGNEGALSRLYEWALEQEPRLRAARAGVSLGVALAPELVNPVGGASPSSAEGDAATAAATSPSPSADPIPTAKPSGEVPEAVNESGTPLSAEGTVDPREGEAALAVGVKSLGLPPERATPSAPAALGAEKDVSAPPPRSPDTSAQGPTTGEKVASEGTGIPAGAHQSEAPTPREASPAPEGARAATSALEADVERLKREEAERAAAAPKPVPEPIRDVASKAIRRTRARGNKAPPPDREEREDAPAPVTDPIVNESLAGLSGEWKEE